MFLRNLRLKNNAHQWENEIW